MRKSLIDIQHTVENRPYPGTLPDELIPYHVYIRDSGHSIMCVLECHVKETEGNYDDYELPVPVKYVLEKGYRLQDGYVIVDAVYDHEYGLMVNESYAEW